MKISNDLQVEVGDENNEGVQKELVCRLTSENDFKKKLEKQSAILQLQENNIKVRLQFHKYIHKPYSQIIFWFRN